MNRTMIKVRTTARKLGLLGGIKKLYYSINKDYEKKFDDAMIQNIRTDDVVWDIGANIGVYTEKFSELVSPNGKVVGFEPAPDCYELLSNKFENKVNVTIENIALSSNDSVGTMQLANNPLGSTHKLSESQEKYNNNCVEVIIKSADSYIENGGAIPNVIKIDVEGFEYDVFQGMTQLLKNPSLRAIFCEIHFTLLEQREQEMAPKEIQSLLELNGFNVKYTDVSHIQALR